MTRAFARTYSELIKLPTFEERFNYLCEAQKVGEATFGSERYLNQRLYTSREWRRVRNEIVLRDDCCDLAMKDGNHEIDGIVLVHHINPLTPEEIMNWDPKIFDPENLITVWKITHNALHYSDINILPSPMIERRPNDTCPWRDLK